MAGTTGEGLRVEALEVKIVGSGQWSVVYQAHVQGIGWQSWAADGATSGTTGQGRRLEAVKLIVAHRP
jgi:uncharacterized protein YjdB